MLGVNFVARYASIHPMNLSPRLSASACLIALCLVTLSSNATTLVAAGPIAEVLSPDNIDRAFRRGRAARQNPLHLSRTTEFPS